MARRDATPSAREGRKGRVLMEAAMQQRMGDFDTNDVYLIAGSLRC